jgi:hypothetical protein
MIGHVAAASHDGRGLDPKRLLQEYHVGMEKLQGASCLLVVMQFSV